MGHIEITANDDRFFLCRRRCKIVKGLVKGKLVVEPFKPVLGVWEIGIDQVEVFKFKREDPSLVVELFVAKPVDDLNGF